METSKNVNNNANMDTDPDVNTTSWMIVDKTALEEFLDTNEENSSSDSDISVISDTEEICSICQSQENIKTNLQPEENADDTLTQVQLELQDNSYLQNYDEQTNQDEKNTPKENDLGTVTQNEDVSQENIQTKTEVSEDLNGTELPDCNDMTSNEVIQKQENYYLNQIFKRRLLIISSLLIISFILVLAGFWFNRKNNIFNVNDNIHSDYKPNYSLEHIEKCVYSEYLQNNDKTNDIRGLYCIKNNTQRTYNNMETKSQNATKLHSSNLDNMYTATNHERIEYQQRNEIIFDTKYEFSNEPQLIKQEKNDEIITKCHDKTKYRAELKIKEVYLNKQDKYLQKKEKYLKKLEKHIKRMESKLQEYNKRLKKYNKERCNKHESNKLKNKSKNKHFKIESTQYDWYTKRYYSRAEIRENEKLSDWLFDRSNMRSKLRNKAIWYFERGLGRENLRATGYNKYEKRKIRSYCY